MEVRKFNLVPSVVITILRLRLRSRGSSLPIIASGSIIVKVDREYDAQIIVIAEADCDREPRGINKNRFQNGSSAYFPSNT